MVANLRAVCKPDWSGVASVRASRQNAGTMSFSTYDETPRTTVDTEAEELRAPVGSGEVWAGILAGFGLVLGIGALFYKPLLFGTFAVACVVFGSIGEDGGRISKVAVPIVSVCVFLGMLLAIFMTHKPIW